MIHLKTLLFQIFTNGKERDKKAVYTKTPGSVYVIVYNKGTRDVWNILH